MTSTTRWNVEYPTSPEYSITSSVKYNTAGAVVSQTDPMSRTVKIGYADNFNSTGNPTTWAYPTSVTDPANNSSTVKYRYDTGANVWAQSPAPAGQSVGKTTERDYDSIGRLLRETIVNNGAYTRYEYPTNGIQSKVYATLVDVNSNGADAADEVLSESWADGAGRIRMSRTEHPGSTGGWAATLAEYNILGQVTRQSVPTEVDNNWDPAGDDLTRGFLWSHQRYDWMGRVIRKIATDGNPALSENDSDVFISYEGCGCAGGMVTTVEGERVPIPGTSNFARRKQKSYEDILGRAFKAETFEWDGTTVYSSVLNTYNSRDQVILSRHFSGNTTSTTYQDTMATFDGFGRLKSDRLPIMDENKERHYEYLPDNKLSARWDARGIKTNYNYNNLGRLTSVTYLAPEYSELPAAGVINIEYDDLGNTVLIEDEMGEVSFNYNELSQLISETRTFDTFWTDAPESTNGFSFNYEYNLGGTLKTVTYPNNTIINYDFNRAGQINSIDGVIDGQAKTLLSNIGFRAWGATKKVDFGNNTSWQADYNNKLLTENEKVTGQYYYGAARVNNEYSYYADGRIKLIKDNSSLNTPYPYYDRLHEYNHVGKLIKERSGREARGTAQSGDFIKYKADYAYDVYGNLTTYYNRKGGNFGESPMSTQNFTIENNRVTGGHLTPVEIFGHVELNPWEYDEDGRILKSYTDGSARNIYDVSGRLRKQDSDNTLDEVWQEFNYDGNGMTGRIVDYSRSQILLPNDEISYKISEIKRFHINSSILGPALIFEDSEDSTEEEEELVPDGWKKKEITNIYGLGKKIASYTEQESSYTPGVLKWIDFEYKTTYGDKTITTKYSSDAENGTIKYFSSNTRGTQLERVIPQPPPRGEPAQMPNDRYENDFLDINGDCTLDGVYIPCSMAYRSIRSGAAVQCPDNYCGPHTVTYSNDYRTITFLTTGFMAYADGTSGHGIPLSVQNTIELDRLLSGGGSMGLGMMINFFAPSQDDTPTCGPGTEPKLVNGKWECVGVGEQVVNVDPPDWSLLNFNEIFTQSIALWDRLSRNISLVGFDSTQSNKILERLAFMTLSKACSDAFKAAGIPSINEVIRDNGILLAHKNAFNYYPKKLLDIGLTKKDIDEFRVYLNERVRQGALAWTPDASQTSARGMPSITIFTEGSVNKNFGENFTHESIHRSGVDNNHRSFLDILLRRHDLSSYEHYESIINACEPRP